MKKSTKRIGTAKVGDYESTTSLLTKTQKRFLLQLSRGIGKPLSVANRILVEVLMQDDMSASILAKMQERIRQEKRMKLEAKRQALDREEKELESDNAPEPA